MTRTFRASLVRDVITASGPDAARDQHSQLSNSVDSLAVDSSCHAFALQPTGRIVALVRVARTADEIFEIDTDEGFGAVVLERLNRFKIRVKCELVLATHSMWALRNLDEPTIAAVARIPGARRAWRDSCAAFDVPIATDTGSDDVVALVPALGTHDDLEAARVACGWPKMGTELTDASVVAETDVVDLAVSFTKGCYPGQELVERMDSRGAAAPHRLVVVQANGLAVAAPYVIDGDTVGRVTSTAGGLAIVSVVRAHLDRVAAVRSDGATQPR